MSKNFQNFPDFFESALLEPAQKLFKTGHRGVLAVSGGADSTALLISFARIAQFSKIFSQMPAVVHVDHRLRGAESDADAEFVRNLARRYGLDFRLERIDTNRLAEETKIEGSLESAARKLRYELLSKAASSFGARYILTAHHAGDRLETMLLRIFRGSSVSGLTGIPALRPLNEAAVLVRPFLPFSRDEILDYLDRMGESYRTDSSNASPRYTRNRIRNELIPLLDSIFPNRWAGALMRLSEHAAEIEPVLAQAAEQFTQNAASFGKIIIRPDYLSIPIPRPEILQTTDRYVLQEFFRRYWTELGWPLREMGTRQWSALAHLLTDSPGAMRKFPGPVTARRTADRLILTYLPQKESKNIQKG